MKTNLSVWTLVYGADGWQALVLPDKAEPLRFSKVSANHGFASFFRGEIYGPEYVTTNSEGPVYGICAAYFAPVTQEQMDEDKKLRNEKGYYKVIVDNFKGGISHFAKKKKSEYLNTSIPNDEMIWIGRYWRVHHSVQEAKIWVEEGLEKYFLLNSEG